MELLKEVANISGKPGLYRILKPGRAGVIVESLDAAKKKEMVSASAKVSVLKEISIYTDNANEPQPLGDVFLAIKKAHGNKVELDAKNAGNKELFAFFENILPDYDKDKVYPTDVKKIINWFNILSEYFPEVFEENSTEEVAK